VSENKLIASVPLCKTPCTLREGKAVIGNWFQVDRLLRVARYDGAPMIVNMYAHCSISRVVSDHEVD
jgi:hypothetical protein